MKVTIRNNSNKRRSKQAMQDIKDFTVCIARELEIYDKIKEVRIRYTKDWNGYYPKGKPFAGFKKLLSNKIVRIDLTRSWDRNISSRHEAIVHELTHVKQLIENRLQIHSSCRSVRWNHKTQSKWRMFRDKFHEAMDVSLQQDYIELHFPWEAEVRQNCDRYIKQ
jgi:hypothetical protein